MFDIFLTSKSQFIFSALLLQEVGSKQFMQNLRSIVDISDSEITLFCDINMMQSPLLCVVENKVHNFQQRPECFKAPENFAVNSLLKQSNEIIMIEKAYLRLNKMQRLAAIENFEAFYKAIRLLRQLLRLSCNIPLKDGRIRFPLPFHYQCLSFIDTCHYPFPLSHF